MLNKLKALWMPYHITYKQQHFYWLHIQYISFGPVHVFLIMLFFNNLKDDVFEYLYIYIYCIYIYLTGPGKILWHHFQVELTQ